MTYLFVRLTGDKYHIFEFCDVTNSELQNDLREDAVILQASTTDIVTEEAPTLGEFFKEQALEVECRAPTQTCGHPASCHSYDRRRHPHKVSTDRRRPSKGFTRHTTSLHFIFVSPPYTSSTFQEEKYERRGATTILLAAHCK